MKHKTILKELIDLYRKIIQEDFSATRIAENVHPQYYLSAKNLYQYLILRNYDLRKYHDVLSSLGISSLRTIEGHVLSSMCKVIELLHLLNGVKWDPKYGIEKLDNRRSKKLLRKHANELFNEQRKDHFTEIMVTMPDNVLNNQKLIRSLIHEGMEIARIDLNYGNKIQWSKTVELIRSVSKEMNKPVKIFMDLAGPKLSIAPIQIRNKKRELKDYLKLKKGDHLLLTKKRTLGIAPLYGKNGSLIRIPEVSVSIDQIIDDLKVNNEIYFDDGMIRAIVISKSQIELELVITKCFKNKLRSRAKINIPHVHLNLDPFTKDDLDILPFVCKNADIVGYSFVRRPEDVRKLYKTLGDLPFCDIGVVLKIENTEAFENLPLILFEAMKRNKIGVMISRGDLAIELGFERIAEVQKQILWLCEAAHIPVIWATQVLENLTKTGIPSRAEITDAALSSHAECVMLHKGPFVLDAIKTLKEILIRMEAHSFKKKSSLKSLKVAKSNLDSVNSYLIQSMD